MQEQLQQSLSAGESELQQESLLQLQAHAASAAAEQRRLQELLEQAQQQRDDGFAQVRELSAQNEALRTQQIAAAVAAPPAPPAAPSFDAEQAAAEREALEVAFRMQMEEVQRNLSAKTMEAETLRHQLAQATAGADAAAAEVSNHPAGSREEHWQAEFRKMQLRMSAVQEEKEVMLKDMREHILQLARENYDLKQRGGAPSPKDVEGAVPPAAEAGEVPVALKSDDASADAGVVPSGGGGWLSYVLAPFLTDSDMREMHAESVVSEATKKQPLIQTS